MYQITNIITIKEAKNLLTENNVNSTYRKDHETYQGLITQNHRFL